MPDLSSSETSRSLIKQSFDSTDPVIVRKGEKTRKESAQKQLNDKCSEIKLSQHYFSRETEIDRCSGSVTIIKYITLTFTYLA